MYLIECEKNLFFIFLLQTQFMFTVFAPIIASFNDTQTKLIETTTNNNRTRTIFRTFRFASMFFEASNDISQLRISERKMNLNLQSKFTFILQ